MSNVDEDLFPDDTISSENSSTRSIDIPYFLQTPTRKNVKLPQVSDNIVENDTNFNTDNSKANLITLLKNDSSNNKQKDCKKSKENENYVKIEPKNLFSSDDDNDYDNDENDENRLNRNNQNSHSKEDENSVKIEPKNLFSSDDDNDYDDDENDENRNNQNTHSKEDENSVKIEHKLPEFDVEEEYRNQNWAEQWLTSIPLQTLQLDNVENDKSVDSKQISDLFSSDDDDDEEESDENDENSDLFGTPSKENYDKILKSLTTTNRNLDFIHSLLDSVENKYRDPEAHRFRINYKYWKQELARRIFNIFNENVFLNKLPSDTKIVFNPRFLTTAGTCQCSYKNGSRFIQINIAPKVCSDADRLLTTMIHEMCHGAVFMINKVREVHGPVWRNWCMAAKLAFPLVPLSERCHNYDIKKKYEYRCESCPIMISRHSKVKIGKLICLYCKKDLVLFSDGGYGIHLKVDQNKPLTGFAAFVKEHYKDARCDGRTHKEAMKILSEKFYLEKLQCETDLRNSLLKNLKL